LFKEIQTNFNPLSDGIESGFFGWYCKISLKQGIPASFIMQGSFPTNPPKRRLSKICNCLFFVFSGDVAQGSIFTARVELVIQFPEKAQRVFR
jgi:hypothetical protein